MRKILCMLLTVSICFGLCCTASADYEVPRIIISNGASITTNHYSGTPNYVLMPDDVKEIAEKFTIAETRELTNVTVRCHSWGNNKGSITFTLYKWDTNYETTKKGKPIAQQTFVDYTDSQYETSMDVTAGNINGDLLLVLSNPVEQVGPWTTPYSQGMMFIDGVEEPGRTLELKYDTVTKPVSSDEAANLAQDAYSDIDMAKFAEATGHSVADFDWHDGKHKGFNASAAKGYYSYYIDFGETSPKGVTAMVYGNVSESKQIQIILDDIVTGQVLCTIPILPKAPLQELVTAKINVDGISGIHKVYFILENGFSATTFKFTKDVPEKGSYEKLLDSFNATNNFTLKSTNSDTWTATDMLGRKLPDHSQVGDYNPDKQVGMFYWTWHANFSDQLSSTGVIQQVIDLYPGPESDIKNDMNYPAWPTQGYWNESIYGVYSGFDEWVMRKQLELLSAAGVDSLFFDATNGTNSYALGYLRLAQQMHDMHNNGIQTPGMAFILPFFDMDFNVIMLDRLYENLYNTGLYSDCWYYFDGKPVIMGYPDNLSKPSGDEGRDAQHQEILDFFTFRPGQPSYYSGPQVENDWPWLEIYPQSPYGTSEKYGCEAVSVGIAMNGTPTYITPMNGENVLGRSYTYKDGFSKLSPTSKYYGYNFQEQWDRAFELSPEFVFVTGWNEWRATHHAEWMKVPGAYPDQYNDEYSRDIEPTKGEFKDSYYYLLASNIRKFKGVNPTPLASAEKSISLDGDFSQWADVGPEFIGYTGGTEPRSSKYNLGGGAATNNTGRNDIVLSKVARDAENLYFYVETAENMTDPSGNAWMQLLINTDRTYKTGWEGYDFIINRVNPTAQTATIEKWAGSDNAVDWKWEKAADVSYKLSGKQMMIAVPRNVIGVTDKVDIEFKWNDNMQVKGDIMDFYVNGDTAPIGRYAYHYVEAGADKAAQDEPVDPSNLMTHKIKKFVVLALDKNYAYKFSQKVKIDDQSDVTAPMIINNKTMVPVRFLAESIGAEVKWNDESKTVQIAKEGFSRIQLTLNSNLMRVEKKQVTLQSPATEIDNRIYVPLRDIVEALDIGCYWVEPGIIILSSDEDAYSMLYVNGGIDQIFNAFEMQYN